jgi:hypothetical protein
MARSDKSFEKRVRPQRPGLEFRMELASQEPGMPGKLGDFDQPVIGVLSRNQKSGLRQRLLEFGIEFEPVPMALPYLNIPIGFIG